MFALYEAYGTRPYEWGTDPDRQKANTKEEETDLNLLNEGMRFRDLETGTFLTRDPIGYADGPNIYCYVHCNPITHFDAFGLEDSKETDEAKETLQAAMDGATQAYENQEKEKEAAGAAQQAADEAKKSAEDATPDEILKAKRDAREAQNLADAASDKYKQAQKEFNKAARKVDRAFVRLRGNQVRDFIRDNTVLGAWEAMALAIENPNDEALQERAKNAPFEIALMAVMGGGGNRNPYTKAKNNLLKNKPPSPYPKPTPGPSGPISPEPKFPPIPGTPWDFPAGTGGPQF